MAAEGRSSAFDQFATDKNDRSCKAGGEQIHDAQRNELQGVANERYSQDDEGAADNEHGDVAECLVIPDKGMPERSAECATGEDQRHDGGNQSGEGHRAQRVVLQSVQQAREIEASDCGEREATLRQAAGDEDHGKQLFFGVTRWALHHVALRSLRPSRKKRMAQMSRAFKARLGRRAGPRSRDGAREQQDQDLSVP